MQKRRRVKQTQSLEQRLAEHAATLRVAANHSSSGMGRERLIRMARQAETASHLNEWLTSPGLKSPE